MLMKSKRKSLLAIVMLVATVLSMSPWSQINTGKELVEVYVNSNKVQFDDNMGYPTIKNERTMVPLRVVSEDLGFKVDWSKDTWDNGERKVFVTNNDVKVELEIGNSYALVNGKKTPIDKRENGEVVDTKSYVENSRTYVPIRFISEALGAKVEYERVGELNKVYITTGGNVVKPTGDNSYIGTTIDTTKKQKYIDLVTDQTSMGKGWTEPKLTIGIYDKSPNSPIRIFVDNYDDVSSEMRFDSKIIGEHSYLNSGTMIGAIGDGVERKVSYTKDNGTKGTDVYSLTAAENMKMKDANGNPINLQTLKGKTVEVEIVAKLNGMTKKYVVPIKL